MPDMRVALRRIGFVALAILAIFALENSRDDDGAPAVVAAGHTARVVAGAADLGEPAPGHGTHVFSFAVTADTRYFAGPGQYDTSLTHWA
jgi:hypothetical protein